MSEYPQFFIDTVVLNVKTVLTVPITNWGTSNAGAVSW